MVGRRQLGVFGATVTSGLTGGVVSCTCDEVGLADRGVLSGFSFSVPTATEARVFERLSFILSSQRASVATPNSAT